MAHHQPAVRLLAELLPLLAYRASEATHAFLEADRRVGAMLAALAPEGHRTNHDTRLAELVGLYAHMAFDAEIGLIADRLGLVPPRADSKSSRSGYSRDGLQFFIHRYDASQVTEWEQLQLWGEDRDELATAVRVCVKVRWPRSKGDRLVVEVCLLEVLSHDRLRPVRVRECSLEQMVEAGMFDLREDFELLPVAVEAWGPSVEAYMAALGLDWPEVGTKDTGRDLDLEIGDIAEGPDAVEHDFKDQQQDKQIDEA